MLDGESLKGKTEGLGDGLQGALPLIHTAPQGREAAGFLHICVSSRHSIQHRSWGPCLCPPSLIGKTPKPG